jgi:hypothetical protein
MEILGTSGYPGRCPGLVYFALAGRKKDSCEDRHGQNKLRARPALPGFASCPAFAGVTEGGTGWKIDPRFRAGVTVSLWASLGVLPSQE